MKLPTRKRTILILNGPNLNLIGTRETSIYGDLSFEEFLNGLKEKFVESTFVLYHQTNSEGSIIDKLHEYGFSIDGIILNAGGYTHTSIAIRDAIKSITIPVIEVHISDISKREKFRHHSYLTEVCHSSIVGKGLEGYAEAITLIQSIYNQ